MSEDSPHTSPGNNIQTEFTSKRYPKIYYKIFGKNRQELLLFLSYTAQYRSYHETEIDNIFYGHVQAQSNCDAR